MTQLNNYLNFKIFLSYLVLSFPITFIVGSAIINLYLFFFLIYFIIKFNIIYENSNKKIFIITFLFWIYLVFNTIVNNYSLEKTYYIENILKSIFFIRILILPIVFSFIIEHYEIKKKTIFKIICVTCLIISLDIIFQFFTGNNILGFKSYNGGMRNPSFFNDEMISGSYLYHFYLISFYLFISKKKLLKKIEIMYIFLPLIILIGIILSGERMALINTYLSIFILIIILRDRKFFFIGSFLFLTIIFLILSSERIFDRYVTQTKYQSLNSDYVKQTKDLFIDSDDLSYKFINKLKNGIHFRLISTAYELTKSSPFFGNGFKSYRYLCSSKFDYTSTKNEKFPCSTHPHNFYVELTHDIGLIGVAIFLIYIILLLSSLLNNNDDFNILFLCIFLTLINPFQITGSIFSTWKSSIMFLIFSFVYNKNDKFK